MRTMETNTITAQSVATLINHADECDSTMARAIELAGEALTLAAVQTYGAIDSGITATSIAALTLGANKDTVGRLAIVGQFLTLEGTVEPDGAPSVAHFVRAMILKLIAGKVSIKLIRGAVTESATQPDALKALASLGKAPKAPKETESNEGENGNDELDAFQSALAAACASVLAAADMMPLAASDDDIASVQSLTDAVALFANAFAARVAAPAVEVVAA